MPDETETVAKTPTPKRSRSFPIRNFAKLLDEFLANKPGSGEWTIRDLKDAVDGALLDHYKNA